MLFLVASILVVIDDVILLVSRFSRPSLPQLELVRKFEVLAS